MNTLSIGFIEVSPSSTTLTYEIIKMVGVDKPAPTLAPNAFYFSQADGCDAKPVEIQLSLTHAFQRSRGGAQSNSLWTGLTGLQKSQTASDDADAAMPVYLGVDSQQRTFLKIDPSKF